MSLTTLTVLDEIMEVLIERLETLVDLAEQTEVVEVIRPTRLGTWTPKDLQIVVVQGESERVPELDHPGVPPAECNRQIVNINCHVRTSEDDDEVVDKIINAFAADVKKAVCTPQATWFNFVSASISWAINAEWLTPENIDSGESVDGVRLRLAITYRHDENDPYTVRV
jgi:hypothetical protein